MRTSARALLQRAANFAAWATVRACPGCVVVMASTMAMAQGPRLLQRDEYRDRLEGMWLGQCIANWTGLRTEGRAKEPPFLTDDDWGRVDLGRGLVTFVLDQDPWGADDDTDIEYVYLHLMDRFGRAALTPSEIRQGWIDHINRYIWVSNAEARELMGRGVLPSATALAPANQFWLKIDAQLTTEFFGCLAPGMPEHALRLADLPIRTTASGFAAHASQVFAVMYSLATQVPQGLSGRERSLWLVSRARVYIPDSSKTADIIDFVTADFLTNPDPQDWERTRDRIHERYQRDAVANGFRYRAWTESSVNFATGIMALLYGQGDYKRTVQIGTLSGWDSDNGTATMGGLLGLMLGRAGVEAQFPGVPLSNRYWISRTRDGLPDYLPGDPAAEDTFALMSQRMIPLVERTIRDAGGLVAEDGEWLLPPPHPGPALAWSPTAREHASSGTLHVRALGGTVSTSAPPSSPGPQRGVGLHARIADCFETDFSGVDPPQDSARWYYSSEGAAAPGEITLTVSYDRDVVSTAVRFVEGDHFAGSGGWFDTVRAEVLTGGVWTPLVSPPSASLDPNAPFQIVEWTLASPTPVRGVRVRGVPGGPGRFATCSELDARLAGAGPTPATFDLNADQQIDIEDLYMFASVPVDLDASGAIDDRDRTYLESAVRWQELRDMAWPGRR